MEGNFSDRFEAEKGKKEKMGGGERERLEIKIQPRFRSTSGPDESENLQQLSSWNFLSFPPSEGFSLSEEGSRMESGEGKRRRRTR